jgi:hypothetical protein
MTAKLFTAVAALAAPLSACIRLVALGQRPVPDQAAFGPCPWPADAAEFTRVWGLTKREAEDLLDWLEGQAIGDCEVSYTDGKGFCVSYRQKT